jgi:hypothetical protein
LSLQQKPSESSIRIFGNPCDAANMEVVHARQDAYAVPQQPLFSGRHTWPDPTGGAGLLSQAAVLNLLTAQERRFSM